MGGNQGGRGFFDPGPLQRLDVGGIPDHIMLFILQPLRIFFNDQIGTFPLLEPSGNRVPYPAASDDEHRIHRQIADVVKGIHLFIGRQTFLGAGQQQNAGALDPALGPGNFEASPLPDAHDIHPEFLAQLALDQRLSHQRGAHHRKFGDDQFVKTADNVRFAIPAHRPCGQGAPQHIIDLQHLRAARHLEDIQRIGRIGGGDDGNPLAQLPNGEGDIRVDFVAVGGDDQGRPIGAQPPVGFRIVHIAHRHPDARIVQFQSALEILHNDDIVDFVGRQLLNQGHGNRIVVRNDHMAPGLRRQLLRCPFPGLGLDPRGIEELDEGERKQCQQEDHPGQKHHDGKGPPQIRVKRDVPKAERRHHREGPVKAGDPRMVLPLQRHEKMKNHAENNHQEHQHQHKPQKLADVSLGALPLEKITHHGGAELHFGLS